LDQVNINLLVDVIASRAQITKTEGVVKKSGLKSTDTKADVTLKLRNKFLEQQCNNYKMDADRIPSLMKEIRDL